MGKNFIVSVFLISCVVSLVIFFSRDEKALRDQIASDKREPLMTIEDFTIYKYQNHKVISTLSGKLGRFIEPNILELYGQLRGFRHDLEDKQYIFSETAVIYYKSQGIAELIKGSSVQRAEIENNVRVGMGSKVLLTEFAEYYDDSKILKSDWEVLIKSSNSWIKGKRGFEYSVATRDLTVLGPIKGTFQESR